MLPKDDPKYKESLSAYWADTMRKEWCHGAMAKVNGATELCVAFDLEKAKLEL